MSRATPKVYRLNTNVSTVAADPAVPQPAARRQRDPRRLSVVLRHEVFATSALPSNGPAGMRKFQDALDTLAAIERDLLVAASCRKFLAAFVI